MTLQPQEKAPATNETVVRVRYAETDQMGVAYYGHYFVWFEVGRGALMRQLGVDYAELERECGCYTAVVDAHCRYKSPARYNDEVLIRTRLKVFRPKLIQFEYEAIRVADAVRLAEGETTHVITDRNMQTRALPEKYARRFEGTAAS